MNKPTYDLKTIKELIRGKHYRITLRALSDAHEEFDFDKDRILSEVLSLTLQDLDKTMPSEKKPGLWQDVYKKRVLVNNRIQLAYIKLSLIETHAKETAVVVSFHKC